MTGRRDRLLDAAIEVVGTRGLRALTHRAVDAEADLAAGSTSNLFRRRRDLVAAMMERLLEVESATSTATVEIAAAPPGDPVEHVVSVLADRVRVLTGPRRSLTVARFALFGEAAVDDSLRELVADSRAQVATRMQAWLTHLGLAVDAAGVSALLSTLNGMLVERTAVPADRAPDPATALRAVLAGAGVLSPDRPTPPDPAPRPGRPAVPSR